MSTDFESSLAKYASGRGAQYLPLYKQASDKYNVPYDVLVRQGAQESGFWNPDVVSGKKKSSSGATGIAQFMPATAAGMGVNPLDAASSIDGQAKYMRKNMDLFSGDVSKAAAGYNWGEGNVQKKGMGNLPAETKDYVAKVTGGTEPTADGATNPVNCAWNPLCWADKAGTAVRNSIPFSPKVATGSTDATQVLNGTGEATGGIIPRIAVGVVGLGVLLLGLSKLKV